MGSGAYGRVWKVEFLQTRTYFAMKIMNKLRLARRGLVHSVMNEKEILIQIYHPFIMNIVSSFQDQEHLYLVGDLLTGGDLRKYILKTRFNEIQTSTLYTIHI
jgi:serine/threonine protein kinase